MVAWLRQRRRRKRKMMNESGLARKGVLVLDGLRVHGIAG